MRFSLKILYILKTTVQESQTFKPNTFPQTSICSSNLDPVYKGFICWVDLCILPILTTGDYFISHSYYTFSFWTIFLGILGNLDVYSITFTWTILALGLILNKLYPFFSKWLINWAHSFVCLYFNILAQDN